MKDKPVETGIFYKATHMGLAGSFSIYPLEIACMTQAVTIRRIATFAIVCAK